MFYSWAGMYRSRGFINVSAAWQSGKLPTPRVQASVMMRCIPGSRKSLSFCATSFAFSAPAPSLSGMNGRASRLFFRTFPRGRGQLIPMGRDCATLPEGVWTVFRRGLQKNKHQSKPVALYAPAMVLQIPQKCRPTCPRPLGFPQLPRELRKSLPGSPRWPAGRNRFLLCAQIRLALGLPRFL